MMPEQREKTQDERWFIGVDTSAYTTSIAAVCSDGRFAHERQILPVPEGNRGLQQSQAVFLHIQSFGLLAEKLFRGHGIEREKIAAVGVSSAPRSVEGSYMPVFTVGVALAKSMAAALGVPCVETSHQEGHLLAAAWSGGFAWSGDPFLAIHLSGGTTELLRVTPQEDGPSVCEILGGSRDLHAGQFVDRTGVALGLQFPAGRELDRMALAWDGIDSSIPASVSGMDCHFSGAENAIRTAIASGDYPPEQIANRALSCVMRTLDKMIAQGAAQTGIRDVLIFGGVAASQWLRENLPARIRKRRNGVRLYFGKPEFSSDNAMGVALAAKNTSME